MNRYYVTLTAGKRMRMGPFTANIQYGTSVDAPTPMAARQRAVEVTASSPGWEEYRTVVSVEQIFTWAITLRGKDDRRKRETFIVHGASLKDAFRSLSYNSNAYHFAGRAIMRGSNRSTDPGFLKAIVKVVNQTSGEEVAIA